MGNSQDNEELVEKIYHANAGSFWRFGMIKIYCDGKIENGEALISAVYYDAEGKVMSSGRARAEPARSKMEAQYLAVIYTLENALTYFALAEVPVELHLNSRAMVKHFNGKWPVKKKSLLKLHRKAVAKIARFRKFTTKFSSENIFGLTEPQPEDDNEVEV
ncbi:MAG: reverse transcriptase-like protein [Candidatus Omnitrophica bacterium]|nr:reverse transcriptase-like protein [Candidatus Omnitrophota bacterium]